MSDWNLRELAAYPYVHCQPYAETFFSDHLASLRYAVTFATFLLYGASLPTKEISLLLFGFGLSANTLLNSLLRALIDDNDAFLDGCGITENKHGDAPSPVAQSIAFFVTLSLLYGCVYRAPSRITWQHALIAALFQALTIFCLLFYNLSSPEGALLGVLVGIAAAGVWHVALKLFLLNWSMYVLSRAPLLKHLGYRNTYC